MDDDSQAERVGTPLPPTLTQGPLTDFGDDVLKVMQRRLNLTLQGDAKELFQLPLLDGGLGFCPRQPLSRWCLLRGSPQVVWRSENRTSMLMAKFGRRWVVVGRVIEVLAELDHTQLGLAG